jgi:hypothetical protein
MIPYTEGSLAGRKFLPALRGRWQGWQTWRKSLNIGGDNLSFMKKVSVRGSALNKNCQPDDRDNYQCD